VLTVWLRMRKSVLKMGVTEKPMKQTPSSVDEPPLRIDRPIVERA
jgi:hypothetical protein